MGKRRNAREIALSILYELEYNQIELETALENNLQFRDETPQVQTFARQLLEGAVAHREALDEVIKSYSRNWRLERMAVIDRNILRLAVYELLHEKSIPPRVSINEAIEISKKFGSAESSAFINGILDKVSSAETNI